MVREREREECSFIELLNANSYSASSSSQQISALLAEVQELEHRLKAVQQMALEQSLETNRTHNEASHTLNENEYFTGLGEARWGQKLFPKTRKSPYLGNFHFSEAKFP